MRGVWLIFGLLACQKTAQPVPNLQSAQSATAQSATAQLATAQGASAPTAASGNTHNPGGLGGAVTLLLTAEVPPQVVTAAAPSTSTAAAPVPAGTQAPAPSSAALVTRYYSVAFVGDSLTDYRSHGGKFIRVLEQRCPESRFDNYGVGGEMTNQMRRRFARQLFAQNKPSYTHIVVFGGVNDLYSDITANRTNDKIQSDLQQMYSLARNAGAQVVALTVSPWGGFKRYFNARRAESTRQLNRWIREQEGHSVDIVLDTGPLLSCGNADRLCPDYEGSFHDGLHFGTPGHERLGQALWQRVFHDCR